jgi:small subunit ribosomal protein SAe
MSRFPQILSPKDDDIKRMLAVGLHLGSQNIDPAMNRYVWRRRSDGIHIINLAKTWEKIVLAARIIAGIENPSDICVISGPKAGHRAVLKFANFTGAHAISGRFTPGTFTNQIQEKFMEPRLLIVTDPRADHQAVRESSYVNVPTIAICNVDSPLRNIDVAIPANNKHTESVALVYWLLAREVLALKNQIPRNKPWDVMIDLFFYRPPEEITAEKKAIEDAHAQQLQQQQQLLHQQQQHQNLAPFDPQARPQDASDATWGVVHGASDSTWDAAAENWGGAGAPVAAAVVVPQQQQQQVGTNSTWDAAAASAAAAPVGAGGWDS